MDLYMVTRMSDNRTSVPNLGLHTSIESASRHFDDIIESRKNYNPQYKCKVQWDVQNTTRDTGMDRVVREAYIIHPKNICNKKEDNHMW